MENSQDENLNNKKNIKSTHTALSKSSLRLKRKRRDIKSVDDTNDNEKNHKKRQTNIYASHVFLQNERQGYYPQPFPSSYPNMYYLPVAPPPNYYLPVGHNIGYPPINRPIVRPIQVVPQQPDGRPSVSVGDRNSFTDDQDRFIWDAFYDNPNSIRAPESRPVQTTRRPSVIRNESRGKEGESQRVNEQRRPSVNRNQGA